ncbi:MarR family winged helix-turn-helix transcriptional regulator [Ectobacillus sp. sgz5001026]|uniref:MarR family winged helix-turn-helix transcriptional regulator n=1 Tax=Ectobacillus sp. sgz5001026 TaxID=3242473 RepID=UPI0036D3E512
MEKAEQLIDRIQSALQEAIRKMQAEMLKSMSVHGITLSQFIVLSLIQRQGKCKVSELADHMDVKPSAMTFMMDRLEQHGFIMRVHDDKDRRVVNIRLSEAGDEKFQKILVERKAIVKRYLSFLSEEELTKFAEIAEKLAEIAAQQNR